MRGFFLIFRLGLLLALCSWATPARADGSDVDARQTHIERLESDRAHVEGERKELARRQADMTAAITDLKAQPTSWSRDRKLEPMLRDSRDLATALDRKDAELRALDAELANERKGLVAGIEGELTSGVPIDDARRAHLSHLRETTVKKLAPPRKLNVVDESIDPLDDPEDLDQKAATLAQNEKELDGEEKRLADRERFYSDQAKALKNRKRADDSDLFQDDQPRRTTGHAGTPSRTTGTGGDITGGPTNPTAGTPTPQPPPTDAHNPPPSGLTDGTGAGAETIGSDPSIVVGDVVEPGTLDELKRAERSGDPEARARATARARKDLKTRAARVHQRRLEIEKRAKDLRAAH